MTKLKAEKPAKGISRGSTFSDAITYHVECSCTDPDHAVDAWIEISSEQDIHDEVEVTFYVKTNFDHYRNVWERMKLGLRVMFGKVYQQQHSLLLTKQAALNFGAAIEQTIEDLENANTRSDQ